MKKILYTLIVLGIVTSCNEDTASENSSPEAAKTEEKIKIEEVIPQEYPDELKILESSLQTYQLPYSGKPNSLDSLDLKTELTKEQLTFLSSNYQTVYEYDDFYLEKAQEFKKLKAQGKFNEYQDNLDIGMLAQCTPFALGSIETEKEIIVLWVLDFSTYEACPYSAGREIYATIIRDGKVIKSLQIAHESAGGDPPVSGTSVTEFILSEDLRLTKTEIDESFEDEVLEFSDKRDTTVIL